jgi:hypothetical protein
MQGKGRVDGDCRRLPTAAVSVCAELKGRKPLVEASLGPRYLLEGFVRVLDLQYEINGSIYCGNKEKLNHHGHKMRMIDV